MSNNIPIYKQEEDDGLTQAIAENASIAYLAPILCEKFNGLACASDTIKLNTDVFLALASSSNFDLYPFFSILTSTDVFNGNDDYFDTAEAWRARKTAEDKPLNVNHVPRHIVGHIVGSAGIDTELQLIPDEVEESALPPKIHILSNAIIYRHRKSLDKSLETESASLIQEVQNGEWYISMECLFADFDYILVDPLTKEKQIVKRTAETAFLTKHLRIYKGSGVYNNKRIGRVFRNITFSGKGLVKKPANPESVIFTDLEQFLTAVAHKTDILPENNPNSVLNIMTDNISTGGSIMPETNELETQLNTLNEQLAAINAEMVTSKATVESLNAKIAELEGSIASKDTEIASLTTEKESLSQQIATLTGEKDELAKANTTLTDENGTLKVTIKQSARVSTLTDGGIGREAAEAFVKQFDALDDTQFAAVSKLQIDLAIATKKPAEAEVVAPVETAQASTTEETIEAKTEALETAQAEVDPTLATTEVATNALMEDLGKWFEQTLVK